MYLIPSPKQLQIRSGDCDIHSGICFEESWIEFITAANFFALPCANEGIQVHICFADMPVPDTIAHRAHIAKQAYTLVIDKHEITITVEDTQGIYAALSSLQQIIEQCSQGTIPCLSLFDYPKIPYRGIMLDVSRGKIPNRASFENIVLLSHRYKYNILQLYWEDSYRIPGHESIGKLNGFYDRQEVAWMQGLCSAYGIELQANIQTFSHMHGLLRLPGYEQLAENEGLFTLAAGNEEVYTFLDEVFSKVLPWFDSSTVHLNMDEAYDIGTGFSQTQTECLGCEQVYVDHINRVSALARKHGAKKMLIWGDALSKYPLLQSKVDSDVVFVDWNYNPDEQYPSLANYDGNKKEFWVSPGTSSWNAIFPRLQNAYVNIKNFIYQAMPRAPMGVLITHWGDYGHHQPLSFSNFGFIYGAEQAYNGGVTVLEQFETASEVLVYENNNQLQAVKLLALTNQLSSVQVGFKSQSLYALFDDFFKGLTITGDDRYPPIPYETYEGFVKNGEATVEVLQKPNTESGNDRASLFTRELLQAARMLVLTGKKGQLSNKIRQCFALGKLSEREILQWIFDIKLLFAEFSLLRHSFAQLWEEEALTIGREGALYLFDKASTRFDEAVRFLSKQRLLLLHGEKIDVNMDTYIAYEDYTTLWTMDCMNFWDRAYPWR